MIRRRFSEEIAEAVQLEIARLGLREGDMLPSHAKLAKKLNVSVPSLREGLQTLATVGVLKITHGKGTIVARPDLSDLRRLLPPILRSTPHTNREIAEMLTILVPEALSRIGTDSPILAALAASARTMSGLESLGPVPPRKNEILRFYGLLGEGSGNRVLAQILDAVAAMRFANAPDGGTGWDDAEAAGRIHAASVEALRQGNPGEAGRLLLDFLSCHPPNDRLISVVFDTFGSGSIGGSFYGLARDLCRILVQHGGISIEPEPTGGGIQNVALTDEGRIILGLTQSDAAHAAYEGCGLFTRRHLGIRAICGAQTLMLWILVRRDSRLLSVGDLRGARIAMGAMGGESGIVAEAVLRAYDLHEGGYRPLFLSLDNAVHGLRTGEVDALFFLSSTPQTAIAELAANIPLTALPVSEAAGRAIASGHEHWFLSEIPAGALPGQDGSVATLAVPSLLITHADVPADVVLRITKVIMEQGSGGEGEAGACVFCPETALKGVSIPLHPGAERYYEEHGIAIPEAIRSSTVLQGERKTHERAAS